MANNNKNLLKLVDKIKTTEEEAKKTMTEEDNNLIAEIPSNSQPKQIDQAELKKIWNIADEARKEWVAQKKRFESSEKHEFEIISDYETKLKVLEQSQEDLNLKFSELKTVQDQLSEKEKDLVAREVPLRLREADADNDFSSLKIRHLDKLDDELSILKEQQSDLRRSIADERSNWELTKDKKYKELENYKQNIREKFDVEYKQSIARLDSDYGKKLEELITQKISEIDLKEKDLTLRENLIFEEKRRIRKKENDLKIIQEILEEEREVINEKIKRKVALEVENINAKYEEVKKILGDVRTERDRIYKLLSQREQAIKKFGDQTPEEINAKIIRSENTIQELQEQLIARPPVSVLEELASLHEENEKIKTENVRFLQDNTDLKRRTNRQEMAVLELETLMDQKALLETALMDLRTKVQDLTQKDNDKPVFPACAQMDLPDNDLQTDADVFDREIDLDEFVIDLQHRIAYDPDPKSEKELYFSLDDIRAFLSGLSMSRLHLLEGISGTGKTSLPLAFARAIGGGEQIIEVQASWRDREDLIGHYNSFENRFHETDFLQALYKAQTKAYKDRAFFIVLDEMNLSHPEQYFADLLSALELDEEKRFITLRPESIANAPIGFTEERMLHIPGNVWFVGTANQDETTTTFAPKTYDRAFVLELPNEHVEFVIDKNKSPRLPISLSSLNTSFSEAKKLHVGEGKQVYKFLTKNLGKFLANNFRIGWGNRLERQIMSFVPVYLATGGSLGDAADFILATKLLRKIKSRNENRHKDLKALDDLISEEWKKIDTKTTPMRSLKLIEDESYRLGNEMNPLDEE